MIRSCPAALALLAGAALSAAAPAGWVPFEEGIPLYDPVRSSWAKGPKPPPEHGIDLTVAVRVDSERRATLESAFWAVSDPRDPRYGQHLSLGEVTKLLAVPEERAARVRGYFLSAGANQARVSPNRDMISVKIPLAAAEAALNTSLHFFSHAEHEQVRIVRAVAGYSLPAEVAADVTMIGELLQFPRLRSKSLVIPVNQSNSPAGRWKNACDTPSCKGLVTPAVLAERYKLGQQSNNSMSGNSMAVAEFQGQYYEDSDLATFSRSCHRDVTVAHVIGGNRPSAGIEAELDIEYIKSVAPEVPLTVVYNSGYSLLHWASEITGLEDPPLVHSVSYGNDEAEQSSTEFMYTCNTAFMKAGVRGISILFASGDSGVCGREGCGLFFFHMHPDFPAGSPYITAVGGTDFLGDDIGPEMAWSASGGGFSNTFGTPSYQQAAVDAYKASPEADLPPQKYWNVTGRGYPDVAALGGLKAPYCVSTGLSFEGVAGTSASSPVVAGVFAKLNGLRLASGKPPLGFLNPFIYQNPSCFQDVTSGKNDNGAKYGFAAIKGWDPSTGLGTPDFEALSQVVMAMTPNGELVV